MNLVHKGKHFFKILKQEVSDQNPWINKVNIPIKAKMKKILKHQNSSTYKKPGFLVFFAVLGLRSTSEFIPAFFQ